MGHAMSILLCIVHSFIMSGLYGGSKHGTTAEGRGRDNAPRRAPMKMSANESEVRTNCKRIGDLPSNTSRIGVDGEGDEHYLSAFSGDIWVFSADGDLEEHYDLDRVAPTVDDWIEFVGEARGWDELNYDTDTNGLSGLVADLVEVLG